VPSSFLKARAFLLLPPFGSIEPKVHPEYLGHWQLSRSGFRVRKDTVASANAHMSKLTEVVTFLETLRGYQVNAYARQLPWSKEDLITVLDGLEAPTEIHKKHRYNLPCITSCSCSPLETLCQSVVLSLKSVSGKMVVLKKWAAGNSRLPAHGDTDSHLVQASLHDVIKAFKVVTDNSECMLRMTFRSSALISPSANLLSEGYHFMLDVLVSVEDGLLTSQLHSGQKRNSKVA